LREADENGSETMSIFPTKILLAFDGSKASSEAARAATEIANATNSELHVVYVLQPDRYKPHLGPEMWEGWERGFERAKQHAHSWLEGEAERMRGQRTESVEAHLVLGRPDAGIVWLAEELDAGLVVVGSRGLGGITRALIGSVSDSVVRHAHCPVLVMRLGDTRSSRNEISA
jgi:nucleotide-binding universal stress UspA family protein